MMRGGPPRLAERLLVRLLGERPGTPYVVADLREEYAALRRRHGVLRANAWYALQALHIGIRVRLEAGRSPARPSFLRGDVMRTELRQALRFLRRRPAFSGAIVLTVALAIAGTTLAFAVVDGVLLEPLPYGSPDRLAVVWEHTVTRGNDRNVASTANFLTWRDELESFDALGAVIEYSTTMLVDGEPERVGGVSATPGFFEVVGARPLIGRLYAEQDDAAGAAPVAVLSEGFWERRFGADPGVLGRTVTIGGQLREIVGVLPGRFDYPVRASFGGIGSRDVWVPPQWPAEARTASGRFLEVVGRLAPGATEETAQAEASALAARLAVDFPDRQRGWDINVVDLRRDLVGDVRGTIFIVFGAVCFVLLIACANVANLLMTRATERQQEIAVRSALGAGRGRLLRQLLTESMVLSAVGGALGIVLAAWGVRVIVRSAPDLPRIDMVGMDASVIAFALLATVGTALLFGLAPALHIAGGDVASWLKERGSAGRRGAQRMRDTLVVAQVALSFVLLIGAGLLVRSLFNRIDVGVGFDVENLLTAEVQVPTSRYETPEAQSAFYDRLIEQVDALAGVRQASGIVFAPLAGLGSATSIWVLDRPVPEPGQLPTADIRWVHRDYHETMGIPLVAGRTFREGDRADAPLVVLISETAARQLWPGENAVGRRLAMPWGDTLRAEVVGVVGDVRHNGPDAELRSMLYFDHRQHRPFAQTTLVVRTAGDPEEIVPQVRGVLRALDPTLPLYNVRSMETLFADALARARFTAWSLGAFAVLALILAAIGIYGVIAYATEQRSREIGIRMALGANRTSVVRMIVRQGLPLIGVAIVIGAIGAVGLSRLLRNLVYEVSTTDPLTFVGMAALLVVTGALACWLPARRASGISPVDAIRYE